MFTEPDAYTQRVGTKVQHGAPDILYNVYRYTTKQPQLRYSCVPIIIYMRVPTPQITGYSSVLYWFQRNTWERE